MIAKTNRSLATTLPATKQYHYFISYRCNEDPLLFRCQIDRDSTVSCMEDIYEIEDMLGKKWKQSVTITSWRRFESAE